MGVEVRTGADDEVVQHLRSVEVRWMVEEREGEKEE